MKYTLTFFYLIFYSAYLFSQDTIPIYNEDISYIIITENDTLLVSTIKDVYIMPPHKFTSKRDMRKYDKLIRNVKVVLPFAKLAKQKYDEISVVLLSLETEKERKTYMEQVEVELKEQFEGDLKKLTISQGRILLKLIDREIGETSYELLKELRGNFSAFFWQTLARLFGHNLKSTFDPLGEDMLLNEIVIMIENGQL